MNIDYAMRGLGSNSCGPPPEEPYELRPHEFVFTVHLKPFSTEECEPMELSRRKLERVAECPEVTSTEAFHSSETPSRQFEKKQDIFACD